MITGFNTNVRHGGRVFHVQTEDSGRSHPHVISHVYHGGTILASEKRGYEELLGEEDLTGVVRRLMEEQHKALVARLKAGELDGEIAARIGGPSPAATQPEELPAGEPAGPAPESTAPSADGSDATSGELGAALESEKPLDEMILEYLVDKARDRATSRPARRSRSRE